MVQAYRDTWELGLHSYLTYMRDRLLLCRELLHPSGSIFVQISDENLHHICEVMDDVFGAENFLSVITFAKTSSATTELLAGVCDYILHYARDKERVKHRQLMTLKVIGGQGGEAYQHVELENGERMLVAEAERVGRDITRGRFFRLSDMRSQRPPGDFPVKLGNRVFTPGRGYWKTGRKGFRSSLRPIE